ncbi:filamentous hemagglutinin N-terminal domain-containing protein [[Phormidium ambiguum] IAM M-71]|uniref:two-partner secretion domain-containing protein n=1 Tax=[Phormidium ambiguum] IAM M-71 TaxID=454136 RepID=UPI0015B9D599|nr:filamentous hemagglutinin N-terminal domain-containing protein [Phormidium ambiguum]
MIKFWLSASFYLLSFTSLALKAEAQIVPDGTLPNRSVVTPQGNVNVIEGGSRAGGNLFHSFQEFSVPTGTEAFFNNAGDIQNIFSRVTGRSISNIDGLIRANGVANLFLLNPNGIIFGPNARLNIGGSFLASTGNSFKFADGIEFSAKNPQGTPLLSINVLIGLQYGSNPGSIQIQGSKLQVLNGQILSLMGGDIKLEGGSLLASGGRVELGGVAGEGTIQLDADGSWNFSEEISRADVFLSDGAVVDVIADRGGSITINARNIDLNGNTTRLTSGIAANSASKAQAGDIVINATGAITLESSRIENNVQSDAIGKGGQINILTQSLSLKDGAQIDTSTFERGNGDAGNIKVIARGIVSLDGVRTVGKDEFPSYIRSPLEKEAIGNAGDISIEAESLIVTKGGGFTTRTNGRGNAGNITITARNLVSFDGADPESKFSSIASTTVEKAGIGNSGNINIKAKIVSLTDSARLLAYTKGDGNAGSITVLAQEQVLVDGVNRFDEASGIITSVRPEAISGNGGNIRIEVEAGSVLFSNGGLLSAATSKGNAGNITIIAHDSISFKSAVRIDKTTRSSIATTRVEKGALGDAGDIYIQAKRVFLKDGGSLLAETYGKGNGGNITIVASENLLLDGVSKLSNKVDSAIVSSVEKTAGGTGGNIEIEVGSLSITNGAKIATDTSGNGKAGNVTIKAKGDLVLDGVGINDRSSRISIGSEQDTNDKGGNLYIEAKSVSISNGAVLRATTDGKGDGGNITINSNVLEVKGGGQILTTSRSSGKAGNISLTISDSILLSGSDQKYDARLARLLQLKDPNKIDNVGSASGVFANTQGGGGNIDVRSPLLFLRRNSSITTNAKGENIAGGNITINVDILAAAENSDISANSQDSRGGQVRIIAQGIFGTQLGDTQTSKSDITATGKDSSLSGTVEINSPEVDPNSGLINLPENVVDTSGLLAKGCIARRRETGTFYIIGTGSLPTRPGDAVVSLYSTGTVRSLSGASTTNNNSTELPASEWQSNDSIIEAQGVYKLENGQLVLGYQCPD